MWARRSVERGEREKGEKGIKESSRDTDTDWRTDTETDDQNPDAETDTQTTRHANTTTHKKNIIVYLLWVDFWKPLHKSPWQLWEHKKTIEFELLAGVQKEQNKHICSWEHWFKDSSGTVLVWWSRAHHKLVFHAFPVASYPGSDRKTMVFHWGSSSRPTLLCVWAWCGSVRVRLGCHKDSKCMFVLRSQAFHLLPAAYSVDLLSPAPGAAPPTLRTLHNNGESV